MEIKTKQSVPVSKISEMVREVSQWGSNGNGREEIVRVFTRYRFRLSSHLTWALWRDRADGLRRQYLPSLEELSDDFGIPDPLGEDDDSPVTGLIHRYKNRIALYVTNACAAFCRFCLRKRKIGQKDFVISDRQLYQCLSYIGSHSEIREVIITGGDPLTLTNETLGSIINLLRAIPHVVVLRVCTRVPVQAPTRIDEDLCKVLRSAQPLYLVVHVNHPSELTDEARRGINTMRDYGVPLLSQSVLLKGVNDRVETLRDLFEGLVTLGVKPYHLYQANRVRGTSHFIVPIDKAVEIVGALWGNISGLAMPLFVYNAEEGKGKIPLIPHGLMVSENAQEMRFVNYKGEIATYYKEPLSNSAVVGQEDGPPPPTERIAD
jgi:lysine 2,3-aminomutase